MGSASRPRFRCPKRTGRIPPSSTNPAGYDLAKAKAFYDQANPKPTSVTVKVSPTYPDEVKMAELMQQSLAQIGLDLQIQQLEWSTWIKDVVSNGDYEMEIVLISGGIDPDDFYYQWLHTGEVFNIVKYSDPQMDGCWIRRAARSTSRSASSCIPRSPTTCWTTCPGRTSSTASRSWPAARRSKTSS